MTTGAADLADRLLDAHVDHLVAELTGPDGARTVASDVRGVLEAVTDVPLHELVDDEDVLATAEQVLERVGPSAAIAALLETLPVLLHDLAADEDHLLGEVVERHHVASAVEQLAGSSSFRAEVLRRTEQSPTLAVLATRFVSSLVSDVVQQNRRRAERLPGVKSMLGVGDFAASKARGLAPRQLEQMLGGAADLGAKVALERVLRALVDSLDDETIRDAAMEIWDLHAAEPVAGLRAYLTTAEVEGLADTVRDGWRSVADTPWFRAVVDAAVVRFLQEYGDHTVADLLDAFGLDMDDVVTVVERHVPGVLEALRDSGRLDALVRQRLEPFYRSEAALEILGNAG